MDARHKSHGKAAIRGSGGRHECVVRHCCRLRAVTATFIHLALFSFFLLLELMLHRHIRLHHARFPVFPSSHLISSRRILSYSVGGASNSHNASKSPNQSQHFYHLDFFSRLFVLLCPSSLPLFHFYYYYYYFWWFILLFTYLCVFWILQNAKHLHVPPIAYIRRARAVPFVWWKDAGVMLCSTKGVSSWWWGHVCVPCALCMDANESICDNCEMDRKKHFPICQEKRE